MAKLNDKGGSNETACGWSCDLTYDNEHIGRANALSEYELILEAVIRIQVKAICFGKVNEGLSEVCL